ncbi:hypothetical protein GCM10020369_55740 [Cryptosporangium minutisporangium]|uniref:BON domain-containing protein n=2 Tax=Cryptosporangium minutisporangium TaxID=113569 RepID=A0ABP6T464_9ACTN
MPASAEITDVVRLQPVLSPPRADHPIIPTSTGCPTGRDRHGPVRVRQTEGARMYYWPFPFPEESGSSSRPADESSRPLSPDEQISATVLARLLLDDRTRPGQVTIQTQAGVVILSGTMPTAEARTVAAQIAATTTGARDVCNILRVPRHRFLLRDRSLAALLVMSAYISLVVGILGGVVGWIALALICALAASAVESRYVRGTQRGRGSR